MIIFNEAKPKYEKLDELLNDTLTDIRFSNQVNIIIDLKEIFKKFFRPDVSSENQSSKEIIEEIASDVLNTIGHYRNYFYKRSKYSSFYLLYSFSKCEELISLYPDYKKEYYEKYFDENDERTNFIAKAAQAVQKVCSIIPNAQFIDTSKFDEFIYAKYIKTQIEENEIILILTNDDIFFQLIDKHTFVINIKGIKSNLLTEDNCIKIITKKDEYNFSTALLPFVLSLSGSKKYSYKNIPSVALIKSCNIVNHLLKENKLVDAPSIEVPIEFSKLNSKDKLERLLIDNKEQITNNYIRITGDGLLYKNKLLISGDFVKKTVSNSASQFAELNSKIFTTFPLQLDMILKGEKI